MALELVTAPAAEPITTAVAKSHLRVDVSDDDTLIDQLVASARIAAETFTRRSLITQTWDLKVDRFPPFEILIPKAPLASVTSLKYTDSAGTQQTWDASNYTVDAPVGPQADVGRIVKAFGVSWPSTRAEINAVEVRFVAGYGTTGATDVPAGILQGMLMMIGHMYENRQNVVIGTIAQEVPQMNQSLWMPYRADL